MATVRKLRPRSPTGESSIAAGPVMVDVEATTLTSHEKERLRHPLVGGVILFARNFQSRTQLAALCEAIHQVRDEPLLIAVDHEGGRVQRFRTDGFTPIAPMSRFGDLWMRDPMHATRLITEAGYVLGAELRACGVDLSFTPVLDLDYKKSKVIGDRALHWDARVVTMLARGLIQGLGTAGMAACGKHFPGHGHVEADSHHDIPVDTREFADIMRDDAAPYDWLSDMVLPSVMPAHVIYSRVDDKPAGFSRFWIQHVLRGDLAYDGVVFSDDLTMQGATVAGDIHDRACAALTAGCDMVLVCNRPDLADELLDRLRFQITSESIERIRRLMPTRPAFGWAALQKNPRYQYARALQSEVISI